MGDFRDKTSSQTSKQEFLGKEGGKMSRRVARSHVALQPIPYCVRRCGTQVCGLEKKNGDWNSGQKIDLNAKIGNHNGQLVWEPN